MKAITITEPGGPEVLKVIDRDIPKPGPGEVLIRVKASGINRPDTFQRRGLYPPPKGASDLPGLEVAGEIVDGDLEGSAFNKGNAVCALTPGGGYAEYVLTSVGSCLPIPEGLSFVEAAGLPETYFTVWSNVFERATLQAGESLLVHGGASGIGTTAIQIAKARGATVYATAGSDDRVKSIEELGADKGINYKTQDFVEEIKALTDGQGVNVVLDMVSGDYTQRNLESLAEDGRLVSIANLGGSESTINMGLLKAKRLTISGSMLRPRSNEYKAQVAQALQKHVWPLLASKKIKPVVYKTFQYQDVVKAHELMEAGEQIGKIIMTFE